MGNIIVASGWAYTFAAAGLAMGSSILDALGIVSTTGIVVMLALGLRMFWLDRAGTA